MTDNLKKVSDSYTSQRHVDRHTTVLELPAGYQLSYKTEIILT